MYKILVGDNDLSRTKFIKRILVRRNISNGDNVILMCDGLQIRESMLGNLYDIVILNEDLGRMSVLNCVQYLIKHNIRHRILIIANNPNVILTREAFLLGVQGVYEAPILVDSFVAIISNLLNNKETDSGPQIYDIYTKYRYHYIDD